MGKKLKRYKVGVDSETYAISMVDAPAIEEGFMAFSEDEEQRVFLESDEKHCVCGAVLVPNKDIYRNDGEREFYISFTEESIEKMSQDFMREYRQREVTLDHETNASEVCVVESWLKADKDLDKSVAMGLNKDLPVGTWFVTMKVNNIETWERIKSGELKGFSVESLIHLEEFNKQDDMNVETNDMKFWQQMKALLKEVFLGEQEQDIQLEESQATQPTVEEPTQPTAEEPKVEEPKVEEPKTEEPKVEEPKVEEPKVEEPKAEEPKVDSLKGVEDLVRTLRDEVEALKEMNQSLKDKVSGLEKQPSAKPINTNAKQGSASTYAAWREQMRGML